MDTLACAHELLLLSSLELDKEAGLVSGAKKLLGVASGKPVLTNVLDPDTGKALSIPTRRWLGNMGDELVSSGRMLRTPHKMPVKGLPPSPDTGQRIVGRALEQAGEAMGPEMLINPVGLPTGAAAGGVVKQIAEETGKPWIGKLAPAAEFVGETAGAGGLSALFGVPPALAAGKSAAGTVGYMAARQMKLASEAKLRSLRTREAGVGALGGLVGLSLNKKLAAARKRMTVPQSRSGRRPMSVETLLRKEKDGSLFRPSVLGLRSQKPHTDIERPRHTDREQVGGQRPSSRGVLQEQAVGLVGPEHQDERPGGMGGLISVGYGGSAGVTGGFDHNSIEPDAGEVFK